MRKNQRNMVYAALAILVVAGVLFWQFGGLEYLAGDKAGTILTITYEDGSTKIFDSKNYGDGLTITAAGSTQPISKLRVEIYVTASYTGTVSTYDVQGTMNTRIIKNTGVEVYNSGNVALQLLSPKPDLARGYPTVITSATITASQLENLISNKVSGEDYRIYWTCPSDLSMTITFADGTAQTKTTGVTSLYLLVKYTSGSNFNSLSATFYKTPYY